MSSTDFGSCDWESEARHSIGSECEWSSDNVIQLINSTPATKRPRIDLKITTPANGVGFNSSMEVCDWSACELNSTRDSTPVHESPRKFENTPSLIAESVSRTLQRSPRKFKKIVQPKPTCK